LEKILHAHPTYVGLVASPKRAESVRDYLKMQGITETDLLPLKAPAGLDIQARRGDEIALSIMAEIVQKRRNAEMLDLALFTEETEMEEESYGGDAQTASDAIELSVMQPETAVSTTLSSGIAIDPICGMEVEIATAKYTFEHEGETYYFCCAGCQATFQKSVISNL